MKAAVVEKSKLAEQHCQRALMAVEDALYVIGGKWKLKIIISLQDHGKLRFNQLQRIVSGISARVLSAELKELEMNGFVKRSVDVDGPVVVEYEATGYSETLNEVLESMVKWGTKHREKIRREYKSK